MIIKKSFIATVAVVLNIAAVGFAKDFELKTLKQATNPTFDMKDVAGEKSYYEYMHTAVGKKMLEMAASAKSSSTNESELAAGHGVSVKLGKNNYNIHINFPKAAQGGRSYGWTSGKVGDWSDAMYLNHLADVVTEKDSKDLAAFYELVIQMLGQCNSDDSSLSIEDLNGDTQRVAANFMAIYTAEEYRAMVPDPTMNWDDAILEVTMLGAFHGGQSNFEKFYVGKFSGEAKEQGSGVYNRGRPGTLFDKAAKKDAEMNDYWQFSANPTSKQSGINITRADFEKMGQMITAYEKTVAKNRTLASIQAVVGADDNVIKALAKYFTSGKGKDVKKIDALAKDVSSFLMSVHDDADEISAWIKKQK